MSEINRRTFLHRSGSAALLGSAAASLALPHITKAAEKLAGKQQKIKIGQIGTKHAHASGKISTMRKFSDIFEVVGVVEPDAARRAALKKQAAYRDVKWLSEEQLLNTPGLQVVAVETEVRDLISTAQRCVDAGLHIHLDKPAGENLSDFKRVLDQATRQGRIVQMGYMYRYNPAFEFLFNAVREGWLGNIFEIDCVMSKKVGDATRKEIAQYPGGTMFELGCHLIDRIVGLLGKPDKVTPFTRRTRSPGDNLADNQLAVFDYPQATATVRSAVIEVEGNRRRQFVVCGDMGTIDIRPLEPPRLQLTLEKPCGNFKKGFQEVELPKLGGRYDGDFSELAQVIRGEKEFPYSPAHDLAVQEAILQASDVEVK